MSSLPRTSILDGRTRAAITSRESAPISMPMPEPKASSDRRSVSSLKSFAVGSCSGMRLSVAPGRVVPAQHVKWGVRLRLQVLNLGGYGPLEVGEAAVGQAQAGGGPHRHHGNSFDTQAVGRGA